MSSEALATGSPVSISQMEATVIQSGATMPAPATAPVPTSTTVGSRTTIALKMPSQSGSRRPRNESHATRGGRPRGGLLAANLRR